MTLDRLETPALIVEKNILLANSEKMMKMMKDSGKALRPHYKSHKCSALAHMQIDAGAIGITCAKLSEAEDLADSGIEDILIANQVVEPKKIRRLAELAGDCNLTVCVDCIENVRALGKAAREADTIINCYVEYEIGMQRCGVTTPEEVYFLAEQIGSYSHLKFGGIQAYAGHVSHTVSLEERKIATLENEQKLAYLINYLKERNIEVPAVSGGSTGTSLIKTNSSVYTEIQAGSYLFMDSTYRDLGLPFENSLFILSTVVSRKNGLIVIDSGVKSCGVDQGMPVCYGISASITASEEHFQLANPSSSPAVGSKVRLIPGHCCSTVNLYDKLYIVDGNRVIDRLEITARGKSR